MLLDGTKLFAFAFAAMARPAMLERALRYASPGVPPASAARLTPDTRR